MFPNVETNELRPRRLAAWIGSALLATSMAGCSSHHHSPAKTTTSLRLPPASGAVLPVMGAPFTVQGVEAGRGIALPAYFKPPAGTSNVYLLLEVKGTFTSGTRPSPGPMEGRFGFHAPECADQDKQTNCETYDIPLIGGDIFLTKEEATANPGTFYKPPADSPNPPQLHAGVTYYALVAESIRTTVPLKDITFCNDKKCFPLAGLPAGSLA